MTVGDWVMMATGRQVEGVANGLPLLGVVTLQDPGPPAVATVLWENGELSSLLQSNLLRVFDAGTVSPDNAFNIGKWVQLVAYPEVELNPDGSIDQPGGSPKSPAAAGLVVRAWSFGPFGGVASTEWFAMATEDGQGFLNMEFSGVANEFQITVHDGRRVV